MNESTQYTKSNRRENLWVNFIFNLVLPILILRKGDDWFGESIGELASVPSNSSVVASILLSIAVLFPAGYGVSDFVRRKKYNFSQGNRHSRIGSIFKFIIIDVSKIIHKTI